MKKPAWLLFFFANALMLNSTNGLCASKPVYVYGVAQGSQLKADESQSTHYILQLGAFKNKQNADRYVKTIAAQTLEAIHLKYSASRRVPYEVYIGPLKDIHTLHAVSNRLLPSQPIVKTTPSPARLQITAQPHAHEHEQHAGSVSQNRPNTAAWTRVITASIGAGWTNSGQTQAILLQPDIQKTYTATNMNSSIVQGEVFAGMQNKLSAHLLGQTGIAVAGATRAGFGGDIWEDSDPELANYQYNYGVQHSHVAIEGKLLADMGLMFTPYINASLGVGFNKAQNFSISPKLEEEVSAPLFQSHTTTAFTYTAGLGVQKSLNRHWQAGLGYLFSDWGKSQLAAAPGQTLNAGPALAHTYVNSVLFNLSYLG